MTISQINYDLILKFPKFIFLGEKVNNSTNLLNPRSYVNFGSSNQRNIGLDRNSLKFDFNYSWNKNDNFFNFSISQVELIKLVDNEPTDLYHKTLRKLNLEFPGKIFDKSWNILKPIIKNLKHKHNRPRPYQLAEKYGIPINLLDSKTAQTPSYPSGHTAYAALGAYILAAKYPQFSEYFFDKVQTAGMARMLMGVHYPSDNEASMIITGAVWEDIRYKLFPELPNF